jgi:hypothetical protein
VDAVQGLGGALQALPGGRGEFGDTCDGHDVLSLLDAMPGLLGRARLEALRSTARKLAPLAQLDQAPPIPAITFPSPPQLEQALPLT